MPNNPIQIVLNAQNYVARAESSGGGGNKDFYAGHDAEFVQHRDTLVRQINGVQEAFSRAGPNDVFYARVELQGEAWAKSHRPVKKVFPPAFQTYVGGAELGTMVVELTPSDLPRIAAVVASAENQVTEIDKKGKPKPSRVRSEVGAIKSFRSYSVVDRRRFSVEQAAHWLADPRTGGAYYVETFVSWSTITGRSSPAMQRRGAVALQRFEDGLRSLKLPITATRIADQWASASVYVIKINAEVVGSEAAKRVHQALLGFLDNEAVVKSILLPPVLQSARLGGEPRGEPVIPAPETARTYPVIGIVDSGVTKLPQLAPWLVGSSDFVSDEAQDVSHGTFIAGLICAGDVLNTDPVFDETRCKYFDLDLHPTVDGSYGNYYPRGFIDFLEQLDAEIPTAKQHGVRVFNMSLAVTTPVADDGYSLFATMLDEIADRHDVLFVLPAGNLSGALAREPWPDDANDALAMVATYRFAGQDRIFQPADSVRSLVVGALDPRKADSRFVPSRYTRRGPGPSLGAKPDIAHVGGRFELNSGLCSLAPNGVGLESCGTSYAAPLAAKTVAALDHAIEGGISRV